jgi:hypothetical protein
VERLKTVEGRILRVLKRIPTAGKYRMVHDKEILEKIVYDMKMIRASLGRKQWNELAEYYGDLYARIDSLKRTLDKAEPAVYFTIARDLDEVMNEYANVIQSELKKWHPEPEKLWKEIEASKGLVEAKVSVVEKFPKRRKVEVKKRIKVPYRLESVEGEEE